MLLDPKKVVVMKLRTSNHQTAWYVTAQKMEFSTKYFFSRYFSKFAENCGFGHSY